MQLVFEKGLAQRFLDLALAGLRALPAQFIFPLLFYKRVPSNAKVGENP
jgi:hypothetical protein